MVPKLVLATEDDFKKPELIPATEDDFKKKVGTEPASTKSKPSFSDLGKIAQGINSEDGSSAVPANDIAMPGGFDPLIVADEKPVIAGRLVTGVKKPATPTETMEDKTARLERYNTIYNSTPEELFENYKNKVRETVSNVDYRNPSSLLKRSLDLSQLEQSREGKVANTLVNLSKGVAGVEDLQYLKKVAPKALSTIVGLGFEDQADVTDEGLRSFLDWHNKIIGDQRKQTSIQQFSSEASSINKKLSQLGIDTMKLGDETYVKQVADQYDKSMRSEMEAVDKKHPVVTRMLQGENLDTELIAANADAFQAWSNDKDAVREKYQQLKYFLGKSYGNAYAKSNPTFTPKEVGEKILQYADPDTYAIGQKANGDYGIQTRDIVKLGIEALYSTGNEGAARLALKDEELLDKTYPQSIIAETYHRLGAELYKGQNWFLNASPSMAAKDAAAKNLPQANREAYEKYIRPVEVRIIGTDIPMSGFVNKTLEGVATTAIGTAKAIGDMTGIRKESDRAKEILNEDTRYADIGTYAPAKQRLLSLNNKLKSEQLTIDELNEKRDLEKFTNVRSKAQEIIDGTGNLTGVVLFQALGTKGLSSVMSASAKGLGLLNAGKVATGLATEEQIAATAMNFGVSKELLNEVAAIGLAYSSVYDEGAKTALQLFPNDEDAGKRFLYSQLYSGVTALSSRVFKDEKVLDVFGKSVSPSLSKLVTNITEGKVAREALGPSLSDIAKQGVKFTGELLKQDFKEATEETLESIGQTTAIAVMAPAKYNYNQAYDEAVSTFATTFINGGVVAGFAAAGGNRNNRLSLPLIYKAGSDPKFYGDVVNEISRQEQAQVITPEEAYAKRQIVETAKVIAEKNIPQIEESYKLDEHKKLKYFGHLLNESVLKRKLEATTDGVLQEGLKTKITDSEIIRKSILNNVAYVTDDYGVKSIDEANTEAKESVGVEPVVETATEEQPVQNTVLSEAVTMLNGLQNLAPQNAPNAEAPAEVVIKTIADQALGRTADGTMREEGGNREGMERIYGQNLVAKAIEAYPPIETKATDTEPSIQIAPGSLFIPDQEGDFAELGPVSVVESKDGMVTVKFDDDTFHAFSQEEFTNNFLSEANEVNAPADNNQASEDVNIGTKPGRIISQKKAKRLMDYLTKKYGIQSVFENLEARRYGDYNYAKMLIRINPNSDLGPGRVKRSTVYHEYLHPFVDILKNYNKNLYISIAKKAFDLNKTEKFADIDHYPRDMQTSEIIVRMLERYSESDSPPSLIKQFFDWITSFFYSKRKINKADLKKISRNISPEELYGVFKSYGLLKEDAETAPIQSRIKDEIKDLEKLMKSSFYNPNGVHTEDMKKRIKELKEQLRSFSMAADPAFNEKPVRNNGESKAEYAVRVLEWRRNMLQVGDAAQQADALKNSQAEMDFIKKVNEGTELLAKNINITHADFNAALGLPVGEFDTYVAALKYMKSSNKEAGKLLNSIRSADPKKVAASEVWLIKKQLHDFQSGYRRGAKDAKEEMAALKELVSQMLADYNELGLLDGVTYSTKDLLTLASKVNKVVNETSFDQLNNFMQSLIDKAEYGKFLLQSNSLIKQVKKVLKSKTVSQNDIPVLKALTELNPVLLQNIGIYSGMLEDVAQTRTVKEVDRKYTNEEIKEFTEDAKQNEVDVKATAITDRFNNIINSQAFKDAVEAGLIPPSVEGWANRQVSDILTSTTTSLEEKKKALNEVNSVVSMFARSVFMKQAVAPDNIKNGISDDSDSDADGNMREQLEEIAKAQQDTIDLLDQDTLSDEQKKSLAILKAVDITGRDSKTLKLFTNILSNVITNDDASGVGAFEVIKRGQDNAKPLLKYLADTGRKILDRSLKSTIGKLRFVILNKSAILTTITNNNAEVSTKLDNALSWNDMTSGFAKVNHDYHERISVPLRDIFTRHPDLHNDPDSVVRLSLFSFLNQSVKGSTILERNAQLQRRIKIIQDDIALKLSEGTEPDRKEAAREQRMLDEFKNSILENSEKDISDPQQLESVTREDFDNAMKKTAVLSEGETEVYNLFRDYQQELQPKHQEIANYYLNEKYEPWENYMKDSYRLLGSGLINVELADGSKLGFTSANKSMDEASSATVERVKGNPLAKKSGESQRVLNLHFYNAQSDGVKGVLEDIYTLADRMAADEGFLNPELKDALGTDNHEMLKKSVTNYVRNEMGVGKVGEKELRVIKKGLDVISKIGVRRQLLSMSAFIKQYVDTIVKTPFNLGKDWRMFFKASMLGDNEGAQGLLKQNGISHRKENLAGLNIISNDQLSGKDNTVDEEKSTSVITAAYDAMSDLMNRFFNHVNKGGVEKEAFIVKPIKYGDYIPATYAWLSYYGQWLVNHGKADSFDSIDWDKENAAQDREAAAYAEQMTSKKLNENTKAGRSMLINDPSIALNVFKNIFFPFGSFNMHNWNIMVEDIRTLARKELIVDENYRKDEGLTAAKSLVSSIVGESVFMGIKAAIRIMIAKYVLTGLVALYGKIFDDEEDKEIIAALEEAVQKSLQKDLGDPDDAWHESPLFKKWYTETIGNLFFGGFGNAPQQAIQKTINRATDSEFFHENNLTVNQQLENQSNFGMIGAAFSGLGTLGKDAYRALFEPDNRFGEEVNITGAEKGIIAATMLSELLTMAGRGDADINRAIEKVRTYVDRGLGDKYKDPSYQDMEEFFNRPTKVSIAGGEFKLNKEQQDFMIEQRAERLNQLKNSSLDEKTKRKYANDWAKATTIQKYGTEIMKTPIVKKK